MKTFLIIFLGYLLFCNACFSQRFPFRNKLDQKKEGFAITVNGDTLYGSFRINYYKGVLYRQIGSVANCKNCNSDSVLNNGTIKVIYLKSLCDNRFYSFNGLTEFDYFAEYKSYYRKIYSGKRTYFDANLSYYDPCRVSNYILINNADSTNIILGGDFKDPKKTLIDFLNQTVNGHYSYKSFNDCFEIINLIEKF